MTKYGYSYCLYWRTEKGVDVYLDGFILLKFKVLAEEDWELIRFHFATKHKRQNKPMAILSFNFLHEVVE